MQEILTPTLRQSFMFTTGFDTLDEIEERIKQSGGSGGQPWRFRMKPGEERNIVFLTGQADGKDVPVIDEHQLKIDGNWGHFFTCLRVMGEKCPLCEAGDRPYVAGFFTVLDRTEYKGSNGNTYKDQVRVLAAKFKSLKQLKKFSQKYGGLIGIEFEVSRSSDKAPSIGDTYIKEDRWDMDDLEAVLGKPIHEAVVNWEEYLAPKPAAELARVAGVKADEYTAEDQVDFD